MSKRKTAKMQKLLAKEWTPDCAPGDAFIVSGNVFYPVVDKIDWGKIYKASSNGQDVHLIVAQNGRWFSTVDGTFMSTSSSTPLQAVESLMRRYAKLVVQGSMSDEEDLAKLLKFLKSRSLPVLNLQPLNLEGLRS